MSDRVRIPEDQFSCFVAYLILGKRPPAHYVLLPKCLIKGSMCLLPILYLLVKAIPFEVKCMAAILCNIIICRPIYGVISSLKIIAINSIKDIDLLAS